MGPSEGGDVAHNMTRYVRAAEVFDENAFIKATNLPRKNFRGHIKKYPHAR